MPFISQAVNDALRQFNDNDDDEVTALINNHNGLTTSDGLPDPSVANQDSIYTSIFPQDISDAELRLMAMGAATAMGANQAGAGSASSGPPPTSVAALPSLPPAAILPVSAPPVAAAPLPTPVAPQVQGAGVPAPVTMKKRRVVDVVDPYCCHLCFAVFTGPGGVRNHLMGATRGGGHAWSKQQIDNDALGRAPRTLGHFTAQHVDTRYTGTNPKQRNNRRRMAQGLDSSQPGYLRDVYGR
ncbi:hypothetical protein LTR84_008451 [Exophiala bonariae]|uniref:C2H2-type domain-containing protein n=1 Tax=Exophiala bonariae TaxID=1690606 RepID=A0AAV9N0H3_9EURO|nr:hypothetical protein LTR84_008451 [Exophiala bonariae]